MVCGIPIGGASCPIQNLMFTAVTLNLGGSSTVLSDMTCMPLHCPVQGSYSCYISVAVACTYDCVHATVEEFSVPLRPSGDAVNMIYNRPATADSLRGPILILMSIPQRLPSGLWGCGLLLSACTVAVCKREP